jgi:hypothetical protein
MFLRFADTKVRLGVAVRGCASGTQFALIQAPIALWESDQLATIDLPVANAVMETVPD